MTLPRSKAKIVRHPRFIIVISVKHWPPKSSTAFRMRRLVEQSPTILPDRDTDQSQQYIHRCHSPRGNTILRAKFLRTRADTLRSVVRGSMISILGSPNSNVINDPWPGFTFQQGFPETLLKTI